ncbi:type VI secretion system Vgr family protein [Francisella uliginis]|uniref:Gp5/Type VI secretion system Vgr protein OB-fold domain-containing protein n=1 Tax=Francisella uliginis TaxID=573570 RepID=A0A1L4BTR9_9GAMM|nr:type VI secretion system tip protein TssI/VgrG [Francisella uliginis]API87214.1 hypothetical protein F7310_07495 [Francisella uliginis]
MKIKLKVNGVNDDTIAVLDYAYESEISSPYTCEVSFSSSNSSLNSSDFMYQQSTLEVSFDDGSSANNIYGIVTEFNQLDEVGDSYEYKIIIEPEIVKLKNQKATNVFLNMSIDEIVKECFAKANLIYYKIELSNPDQYPKREFVFQYQETYFDFISRWLEYEGIYYYFDFESVDKKSSNKHKSNKHNFIILTDQSNSAKVIPSNNEGTLSYDKNALISNNTSTKNYVMSFFAYTSTVPKKLTLNGYDYENDSQTMSQTKQISSTGLGDVTIFDENAIDDDSIKRIINIRCQGMACMEHVFMGSTNLSNMNVGRYFKLTNHFRKDYNNSYFITAVSQTFSQRALFLSKFSNENEKGDDMQLVTTDFKAIPLKTQYRPQLLTPVKKIDGVIPAIIDSEKDDDSLYLDDQGRYKIKFLHSDDEPGKGSGWIRKVESFLGNKLGSKSDYKSDKESKNEYGTSIPLHKGVEVSVGFEYGNPDKPIIVGAVQNSSHGNLITEKNSDQGYAFKSAQGNFVEFSDEKGEEYVKIYSPFGESFHTVGYTDLDKYWDNSIDWIWGGIPEGGKPDEEEVASLDYSEKAGVTIAGSSYSNIIGDSFSVTHGDSYTATMGKFDIDLHLGAGMNEFNLVGEKVDVTAASLMLDSTNIIGAAAEINNYGGIRFESETAIKKYTFEKYTFPVGHLKEAPDVIETVEGNHIETVGGSYTETVTKNYNTSAGQMIYFGAKRIKLQYSISENLPPGSVSTSMYPNIDIKSRSVGITANRYESRGLLSFIDVSKTQIMLRFGNNSIYLNERGIQLASGPTVGITLTPNGITTSGITGHNLAGQNAEVAQGLAQVEAEQEAGLAEEQENRSFAAKCRALATSVIAGIVGASG